MNYSTVGFSSIIRSWCGGSTCGCNNSEPPSPSQIFRKGSGELIKVDGRIGCDIGTWVAICAGDSTILTRCDG